MRAPPLGVVASSRPLDRDGRRVAGHARGAHAGRDRRVELGGSGGLIIGVRRDDDASRVVVPADDRPVVLEVALEQLMNGSHLASAATGRSGTVIHALCTPWPPRHVAALDARPDDDERDND
ncbi:MAG: hypothetical protein M3P50_01420 [Actinomycetota bacterium]|nr:hypothetical protein [Actinomycetota bacterium]